MKRENVIHWGLFIVLMIIAAIMVLLASPAQNPVYLIIAILSLIGALLDILNHHRKRDADNTLVNVEKSIRDLKRDFRNLAESFLLTYETDLQPAKRITTETTTAISDDIDTTCEKLQKCILQGMADKIARDRLNQMIQEYNEQCNHYTDMFLGMDHAIHNEFEAAESCFRRLTTALYEISEPWRGAIDRFGKVGAEHYLHAMQATALNNLAVVITMKPPPSPRDEAGKLFENAVALGWDSAPLWRNYARWLMDMWLKSGNDMIKSESIKAFERAIEADENYAMAYVGLGALHAFAKDRETAEDYFRIALDKDSDNKKALINMSLMLKRRSASDNEPALLDTARFYARRAIEVDPEYDMAWSSLGDINLAQNDLETAEIAYQRALELQDEIRLRAILHSNLGVVYERKGNLKMAVSEHKNAIKVWKRFAPSWYNLGNILMKLKRRTEAYHAYRTALGIDKSYTRAWYNLGFMLEEDREMEAALKAYHMAIETDSDYFLAQARLGRLLLEIGKYAEAEQHLLQAQRIRPDDVQVYYELARLSKRLQGHEFTLTPQDIEVIINERDPDIVQMMKPQVRTFLGTSDPPQDNWRSAASITKEAQ